MSLDTEQAQPPDGKSALAVIAPSTAAVLALAACSAAPAPASSSSSSAGSLFSHVTLGSAQPARVNVQPLPPPVVTLSHAQIAEIKG